MRWIEIKVPLGDLVILPETVTEVRTTPELAAPNVKVRLIVGVTADAGPVSPAVSPAAISRPTVAMMIGREGLKRNIRLPWGLGGTFVRLVDPAGGGANSLNRL
jgi:hypothetical protein